MNLLSLPNNRRIIANYGENCKNCGKAQRLRITAKVAEKAKKIATLVRRLLMGAEKPKFLAQNCAKNVTENIGSLKKTTKSITIDCLLKNVVKVL